MRPSREPALWIAVGAAAIQLTAAFFVTLTVAEQALLNAAVVALAGFLTAVLVRRDGQVAAILGLAQAAIAVGVGFGLDWGPEKQAAAMAAVTSLAAAWARTQMTAKVGPEGQLQG